LIRAAAAIKKASGLYMNDHEAMRRWILESHPDIPEPDLRKLVGWYTADLRRARRRFPRTDTNPVTGINAYLSLLGVGAAAGK
jgi:hypothetical protein